MRLFKTLFGKSNKLKSDESDILSLVLRVTNQDSNGDRDINLSGAATLLLNINEHTFFTDINSSLKELEKELLIPTVGTPLRGFKSDMYNSFWIVFENSNNQKMVDDINSVSAHIANLGLGNNMTAAIFKGTIKNQSFYWICNYRTSKFYPLAPLGKEMRDNKLEMEIGNLLASMGIPLEPHENWYSLSDIPI
ncbi:MAG TPA: hypothetical protein EYN92_03010 [Dehalococcoidia bacterium]|nr:hypothetical protein [Dehalococcoidia bacterium]